MAATTATPTTCWRRPVRAPCRWGGPPLGIYGGRANVMDVVAPLGPVYQAGTLSGNPVAVAAGLATLKRLDERAFVALEGLGRSLEDELARAVRRTSTRARVQRVG